MNSGVGTIDPSWESEKQVIEVNVIGFVALANWAMEYFKERGGGHIVGISSIAALKGYGRTPAYCASKAFISTYMQGLQQRSNKKRMGITVTDVKPGFVATPMTEKNKGMFWVAPVEKAARQIYQAIAKRKRHAYITRRWRLVAWAIKAMPDRLYERMGV
ncbi:MAG: SDR family NAD(P)-dependent oxidoreductase [Methanobacteriota archaeon]|nr:MAG: SDR family NAD(P)-dependent oxidoreductase [Euryarchaeota archaeon]